MNEQEIKPGMRFRVLAPSRMFPKDFEVIEVNLTTVRIKNESDTYTVSKTRLNHELNTGIIELIENTWDEMSFE